MIKNPFLKKNSEKYFEQTKAYFHAKPMVVKSPARNYNKDKKFCTRVLLKKDRGLHMNDKRPCIPMTWLQMNDLHSTFTRDTIQRAQNHNQHPSLYLSCHCIILLPLNNKTHN